MVLPLNMGISHSYVSLPEGKLAASWQHLGTLGCRAKIRIFPLRMNALRLGRGHQCCCADLPQKSQNRDPLNDGSVMDDSWIDTVMISG